MRKSCERRGCDGYIHLGVMPDGGHAWCPEAVMEARMKAIRDLATQIQEEVEELSEEKPLNEQVGDLQELEYSAKELIKKTMWLRLSLEAKQRAS